MPYSDMDTPESRAYKLLQRTISLCTVCVIAIVTLVFLYAGHTSQSRCQDLQGVRSYVLNSTDRSIKALPTLAYYKAHPDELADALKNLKNQRDEFATPLDCSLF